MAKNKSVFGIYSSRNSVESALTVLRDAGFPVTDVSVLLPENLGGREIATQKETKAPEGGTAGAGAGVGGVVGGVTGALVGMGIPEYEAKRYEGRLQKGGILGSVHCDTSDEV